VGLKPEKTKVGGGGKVHAGWGGGGGKKNKNIGDNGPQKMKKGNLAGGKSQGRHWNVDGFCAQGGRNDLVLETFWGRKGEIQREDKLTKNPLLRMTGMERVQSL